jgi:hypothetical protein
MWTPKTDRSEETVRLMPPDSHTPNSGSTPVKISSSSESAGVCRWSPDAVRRLDEEVEWALTSNPTGAAEIAGVLLGKSGPKIEITDCQPVFLMHPPDHAYALTGPGVCEFERAKAAFPSILQDGLSVVGFYRSHMGDEFRLTEEDLGLLRTTFRDTSQVVLLIQRTVQGPSGVKLFVGDECQMSCEWRPSEDAAALPRWLELWDNLSANGAPQTPGPKETKAPADTPAPQRETVLPGRAGLLDTPIRATSEVEAEAVLFQRHSKRTTVLLLAAAILFVVLVAYPMFKGSAKLKQGANTTASAARQAHSGGSPQSGVALRIEKQGDDLQLDWDRTAPALVAATGGLLTIRERNRREKQVIVDGNLLRGGSIVYRPVHGDVFVRLVIFGQGAIRLGESTAMYPQRKSAIESNTSKETK